MARLIRVVTPTGVAEIESDNPEVVLTLPFMSVVHGHYVPRHVGKARMFYSMHPPPAVLESGACPLTPTKGRGAE